MSALTRGRIVHYKLDGADVRNLLRLRDIAAQRALAEQLDWHWPPVPRVGDVCPALVVGGTPQIANLQAWADGPETLYLQHKREGTEGGTWSWPPRS